MNIFYKISRLIREYFSGFVNVFIHPFIWVTKYKVANKNLVLVIGMHRSGSSALMGVLEILGLPVGKHLIPPLPENPKGFFEDKRIVKLNNQILKRNNTTWYGVQNRNKSIRISPIQKIKLINILVKSLYANDCFGIKDPRLSVLAPTYIEVANILNLEIKAIVIHRNSKSVIMSLLKRNNPSNISMVEYERLYDYYYSEIAKQYKDYIIGQINFEDLILNPQKTLQNLEHHLQCINNLSDKIEEVNDFLDIELIHNR